MKKSLLIAIAIAFVSNATAQTVPVFENFDNGLPPGWSLVAAKIDAYSRNVGRHCTANQGIIAGPSIGSNGNNKAGFETSALQYVSANSSVLVRFEGYVYKGNRLRCEDQLFGSTPCTGVGRIYILAANNRAILATSAEIPLNLNTGLNTFVAQLDASVPANTEFIVLLDIGQVSCNVNGSLRFAIDNVLITATSGGPLPVYFKSFKAMRSSSQNVLVTWVTATEQNNNGFYVQRNTSSRWENMTFVPTRALNGNSSIDLNYSFTDANITKGFSQYRILQLDINGGQKISEVSIVRGDQNGKISVFPNPSFDGNATVLFEDQNSTRDISILDMTGRVVKQWINIINNNLMIENLKPGFYSIRIFNKLTGELSVQKIVVNQN